MINDRDLAQAIRDIRASLQAGRVCGQFSSPRNRRMPFKRQYFEQLLEKFTTEDNRRKGGK